MGHEDEGDRVAREHHVALLERLAHSVLDRHAAVAELAQLDEVLELEIGGVVDHLRPFCPWFAGRSISVERTTCVCVRSTPLTSRMRSSASSRCLVSSARMCRIALGLAGHRVGADHLGMALDGGEDLAARHPPLAVQAHEGVAVPAELLGIDGGAVAGDDPVLLQAVDTALDRRRAEGDLPADVLERTAGVLLQERNDPAIYLIHITLVPSLDATNRHCQCVQTRESLRITAVGRRLRP